MSTSRRLIAVALHPKYLVSFFTSGEHHYSITDNGVPKNARVVQFGQNVQRGEYYIVLEHETFSEVSEGEMIPVIYLSVKDLL